MRGIHKKPDTMGLEIYSICKAVLDSLILK